MAVKGRDIKVSLREQRYLDIQVSLGARDSRRVEGLLRKAVKSFGNGSTWELITEGTCKASMQSLSAVHAALPLSCQYSGPGPQIDIELKQGLPSAFCCVDAGCRV